jgi:hypothetical protein
MLFIRLLGDNAPSGFHFSEATRNQASPTPARGGLSVSALVA